MARVLGLGCILVRSGLRKEPGTTPSERGPYGAAESAWRPVSRWPKAVETAASRLNRVRAAAARREPGGSTAD